MNEIQKRLEQLMQENDGLLMPELVVDDARDENSVLHKHFDWNDSSAAEKYRLEQARGLIRSVKVQVIPHGTEVREVRAFVSVPSDRVSGGYRDYKAVLNDSDRRKELAQEMEIQSKKWEHLAQFWGVQLEIMPTIQKASKALRSKQDEIRAQ